MPCLSQPPPGTVMVRLAPPEGVKSQVPAIDVVVGSAAVEAAHDPPADVPPEPALPPVLVAPPSELAPPALLRPPAPDCPPELTVPPPVLAPAAPPGPA